MGVTDNGKPVSHTATTTVKVIVSSNTNPPRFNFPEYRKTVKESDPVGTTVIRVTATRNPLLVRIYFCPLFSKRITHIDTKGYLLVSQKFCNFLVTNLLIFMTIKAANNST